MCMSFMIICYERKTIRMKTRRKQTSFNKDFIFLGFLYFYFNDMIKRRQKRIEIGKISFKKEFSIYTYEYFMFKDFRRVFLIFQYFFLMLQNFLNIL